MNTNNTVKLFPAQSQLARYARQLHQRAYDVPELRDDDVPAHLRNSPSWIDLYGQR